MKNIQGLEDFDTVNERKHIKDAFDLKSEIIAALSMGARAQKHVSDLRLLLSELDNVVSQISLHFTKEEAVSLIDDIKTSIETLESGIKRKTDDLETSGIKVNTDSLVRSLEKLKDGFMGKPRSKPVDPEPERPSDKNLPPQQ